ncbi:MAG: S-layer homology domain-containing protein [Clostridia bacterium]|nr:S-layer homology domain-containing protein [Clostridia bacterium]
MKKKLLSLLTIILAVFAVFVSIQGFAFADETSAPGETDPTGASSDYPQSPNDPDPAEPSADDPPAEPENPFEDVKNGKWYTKGVLYCYENGYMSGIDGTHFDPNGTTTRAMFVQILAKVAGADLSGYDKDISTLPFTDVKSAWYTKALKWAYENKFTGGTGANTFTPNGKVTREQVATFLYTFAQKTGLDVSTKATLNYFHKDGSTVSKYAVNAMVWAVDIGLISGTADETLTPKGNCTRAQISLMIKKFIEYYSSTCSHVWTKPTCTTGSVCEICGYTKGTPYGHSSYANCKNPSKACIRCGRIEHALGHDIRVAATCTTDSSQCTRCGYYIKAFGHDIIKAPTCTDPSSPCVNCGYQDPPLGHKYVQEATCTTRSSKCVRCGKFIPALGHDYQIAATCTTPSSKCTRCGNIEAALGHDPVDGKCSRCGLVLYTNKTDQLRYFLKNTGTRLSDGSYMSVIYYQNFTIRLLLLPNRKDITMDFVYYYESGSSIFVKFYIPALSTGYNYDFGNGDGMTGNSRAIASGYLDGNTYKGGSVTFSSFSGGSSSRASWQITCGTQIDQGLKIFRQTISGSANMTGGITMADMGFKHYS